MGTRKLVQIPAEQPERRKLKDSRAQKAPDTLSKFTSTTPPPTTVDAPPVPADAPMGNPYKRLMAKIDRDNQQQAKKGDSCA